MQLSVRSIQGQKGAQTYGEFHEPWDSLHSPDDEPGDDELELVGPIHLQVTATNLGNRIGLVGRLRASARLSCSRCAQDYVLELDEPVEEVFVRREHSANGRAHGEAEDVETGMLLAEDPWDEEDEGLERPYSGSVLQLDDVVRETLLLAIPMKPVCREDCRGLCPVCGVNRNEGTCGCIQDAIDPRLAELKRWLEATGQDSTEDN